MPLAFDRFRLMCSHDMYFFCTEYTIRILAILHVEELVVV
jgi:hypothetical protein